MHSPNILKMQMNIHNVQKKTKPPLSLQISSALISVNVANNLHIYFIGETVATAVRIIE